MNIPENLEMTPLLAALAKIAGALNARHITWAIGGSTLLSVYGIVDAPNDLDLLVDEADISAAVEALNTLGQQITWEPSEEFCSHFFVEFVVEGIEVDVMAGLTIKLNDGGHYTYPFSQESIAGYTHIYGIAVPLTSLQDWHMLYSMMAHRESRVAQIETYLGLREH